jgi:hypothetical protein
MGLCNATIVCFGHIWVHCGLLPACGMGVVIPTASTHKNRTQGVFQPAAIAICKTGNHRAQQVTESAVMQNRNYSAEGTCGQQHQGQQVHSSWNHSTRSIIHCSFSELQSAATTATIAPTPPKKSSAKNMHQDTNQISGQPQPVHTKNVKYNSTDDVFLAFSMVQQI